MKLFARFFLILLAFALLPVLAMGAWMFTQRQALADNARALHTRMAVLAADVAERTAEQLNRALVVVEDLDRSRGSENLESSALRKAAAADSSVALIALLDKNGQETFRVADPEYFRSEELADRSREEAVVERLRMNRLMLGSPYLANGMAMLPAAHPLVDGRTLYLAYSLRGLGRRLDKLSKAAVGRGRILFVDSAGKPVPGLGDAPPAKDWTLAGRDKEGWLDDVAGDDGPYVAAYALAPASGLRAVSLQSRREAYASSEVAAARATAFFAAICLLVAAGAYGLSVRLLQPVTALISAAERVSRNDFQRPVPALGWGELDQLGATFNAMTAKVKTFQEIQIDRIMEEKAKIDALVKNIPEAVLLCSFDGTMLYANATAARVLGVKAPDKPVKVADILKSPDLKRIVAAVQSRAKRFEGATVSLPPPEGGEPVFYAARALTVVRDRKEVGILVLLRDITVEREVERMKEEFFHAIVHDLRGPITVIDGIVHFMKRMQNLGDKEKTYVELAEQASKRLGALVTDILDIAKLESGTMTLVTTAAKTDAMLAAVRSLYSVPAEGKGIKLEAAAGPALDLACDTRLVERVLMNLVGNAMKFTPTGGAITLSATAVGGEVEFAVKDTGPGIPADKLDAVFEKFKQLDRDAAKRAGYGLGLSICRKIVELHGGRIWVESKPGDGSRFAFTIPRAQKPVPAPAA
ncbi:MAG: ATP-binding protein [Elusimicrobiota bacterium]|nr:ATP-binding protein [Elusimicrobiota bacterium]